MKRKLVLPLIVFLLGFGIGSVLAKVFKHDNSEGEKVDGNSSLLWKVSGNGLEEPSYVFGTIHMICSEKFYFPDEVKSAIEGTDKTVLELDMDDPAMPQQMQQLMLNPGMKNISGDLDPKDKELIDSFLKAQYGVGLDQFGVYKPFALLSMAMVKLLPCEIKTYEQEIMLKAKETNKEVEGLETVAGQIGIFDDIDQKTQIEWIIEMLSDQEATGEELDELATIYLQQDMDKLLLHMEETMPEYNDFDDVLLDNRNMQWIPRMKAHMEDNSVFFGVGAGHLGGENGVIKLLQKEGFTVEPVVLTN